MVCSIWLCKPWKLTKNREYQEDWWIWVRGIFRCIHEWLAKVANFYEISYEFVFLEFMIHVHYSWMHRKVRRAFEFFFFFLLGNSVSAQLCFWQILKKFPIFLREKILITFFCGNACADIEFQICFLNVISNLILERSGLRKILEMRILVTESFF